ncbi:MAG: Na(+)/H(+) antiporter subunit D [Thermodesulfovibrionales bacterium]|nr:Na(+)/H(+) antiporter subunit D [Thermodesulfovibrionales bacterium]
MINPVPPAAIFIIGALLIPLLKGRLKSIYLLLLPIVGFINLINIPEGMHWVVRFLDYELVFGKVDRLSLLFGYIYHLIAFIIILYSLHLKDNAQHVAGFIYAGSSLGVVFAGDLISLYLFWEMMTFSAVVLVWSNKTGKSIAAGFRYLLVHVFGGLCLLAGIVLYVTNTGSIEFGYIGLKDLATFLIFIGFGVNCAWPGLHPWLPDAYPESTITGAVFMWTFTTKTAVYVLARAFPGTEALIWIGTIMTAFPIFFAVIENNLRRVLSYSLINQVGYMVCGIGIGTELSINGTVSHVFCHILYKGLLVMSMGAVMYRTGKINCTDLGGLYKSMPLTSLFCIVGAASISGFPLFSGFVCKSMVLEGAALGGMSIIWFILMFASVGVLEHAGIKVPYYAFFSHDSGIRTREAPLNMLLAMGIAAFLCIFIGVFPGPLYSLLPYHVDFEPYTTFHVVGMSQLLFFGALAYVLFILSGVFPAEIRAINLDADWFYRKAGTAFYRFCNVPLNSFRLKMQGFLSKVVDSVAKLGRDPLFIPELAIRYVHLKIAQILIPVAKPQGAKERLAELEFKLRRIQKISESGREYGADIPRRPIGLGVLLAFVLIFFYLLIYMLF